jgi:hypothetical protein
MNLLNRLKAWFAKRKRLKDIKKRIRAGELLLAEECDFFTTAAKKSPVQFKAEYDKQQAEIAERNRIAALDHAEQKYRFPGLDLRIDQNGFYYFSRQFVEFADKYYLVDYQWSGPAYTIVEKSVTTGTDKRSGNAGKVIVGGLLLGPIGAIAGATARKTTNVNRQTLTTTEQREVNTNAILVFVNASTRERVMKNVACNSGLSQQYTSLRYTTL